MMGNSKNMNRTINKQNQDKVDDQEVDFKKILKPYASYWKGILVSILVCSSIATSLAFLKKPTYKATARILVTTPNAKDLSVAFSGDALAKSRVKTYLSIATTSSVAQEVQKKLNWDMSDDQLVSQISATAETDTTLLSINAKADTGEQAKQLADTWVKVLTEQLNNLEVSQALNTPGVSPSQEPFIKSVPEVIADIPKIPVSPNKNLYLVLGAGLGAGLGAAYAWYKTKLDKRISSRKNIEDNFNPPVIGLIPFDVEEEKMVNFSAEAPLTFEGNMRNEAYRELRANLRYSNVDKKKEALVVSSPDESDGKTTVVTNLALSIAATGQKVVVIDCDLRRPQIAKRFGVHTGDQPGLAELLSDQISLDEALIKYHENENITLLPSGKIPPKPAELLHSESMQNLIDDLKKDSIVLLDSPPLLHVNDAAVLGRMADGILLLVAAGKTTTDDISECLNILELADAECTGFIFKEDKSSNNKSGRYGYGFYGTKKSEYLKNSSYLKENK